MAAPLLAVRGLSVRYRSKESETYALDDVSLDLAPGRITAVVGESGCGKSTLALAILGLLPDAADVVAGRIDYRGRNLLTLPEPELRSIRGRHIAVIFQDPVAGLNPVLTIGDQVAEILTAHLRMSRREAKRRAVDVLAHVGLPDPERVARAYPFQLSGGMCQRVMIAIATALDPEILIADEPTSALDVTVQAQILHELQRLRRERGMAVLLITHDFGVVAQMADHVSVMYAGRIVERGPVETLLKRPRHPYGYALLSSLPGMNRPNRPLPVIPGAPPELSAPPAHCPFVPRCWKALARCRIEPPPALTAAAPGHEVACYNPVWHDDAESSSASHSSGAR
ncbi:MAG: ABC transporter ATP-binding protein [Chloroflexota bacterium]|nr:ABC transporter ATP-binding protein [Dehalococcoidia bacterium]MDW8046301.1 ABC transporter ATP-binding protein [Chloroflexota bacterium]